MKKAHTKDILGDLTVDVYCGECSETIMLKVMRDSVDVTCHNCGAMNRFNQVASIRIALENTNFDEPVLPIKKWSSTKLKDVAMSSVVTLPQLLKMIYVDFRCRHCGFDNTIRFSDKPPVCQNCEKKSNWPPQLSQAYTILKNAFEPAIKAVVDTERDRQKTDSLICVVNTQNFSVSVHKSDLSEFVSLVIMNNETLHARHLESLIEALTMLLMEYERFKKKKNGLKTPIAIDGGWIDYE